MSSAREERLLKRQHFAEATAKDQHIAELEAEALENQIDLAVLEAESFESQRALDLARVNIA